jgi:hypothetical protein
MSFNNNSNNNNNYNNNNNNTNNNYIYALYEYFIKHNKQDIDKKSLISIILPLLVFKNKEIMDNNNNILQKVENIIQELIIKNIVYVKNNIIYSINEMNQEYLFFVKTNELIESMGQITYDDSNLNKNIPTNNKFYIIPSESTSMKYEISSTFDYCSCPYFTYNQIKCKHLLYYENHNTNHLEYFIKEEEKKEKKEDKDNIVIDNEISNEELEDNKDIINTYIIPSMSSNRKYNISTSLDFCNCPYFLYTQNKCKHIEYYIENDHLLEYLEQEELELIYND